MSRKTDLIGCYWGLKLIKIPCKKTKYLLIQIHGEHHHPDKTTDTIILECQVKKILHFAPIVILPSYFTSLNPTKYDVSESSIIYRGETMTWLIYWWANTVG